MSFNIQLFLVEAPKKDISVKFEDYYRLRQQDELDSNQYKNATKVEQSEFLDEYRQIDSIILEFHNEFYVFDSISDKFNTLILLIILLFLIFSFVGFSLSLLSIASFEFLKYFFVLPFEIELLINLLYINIGISILLILLFTFLLFLRDKGYESSYYEKLLKTSYTGNEYTNKGFSEFKDFKVRDYRMYWIKCLFAPKDIEYVFKVYNSYVNYKDELDQAVSVKGFLSNRFIKGVFAIFTTGAIGFLASYNANIYSKDSVVLLKSPEFFSNAMFMIFYALLFLFLTYFLYCIVKDWFFNFIDLFRKDSEITEVRKKRLVYYIHQSRVINVKGRYGKLSNHAKKIES